MNILDIFRFIVKIWPLIEEIIKLFEESGQADRGKEVATKVVTDMIKDVKP